MNGLRTEVLEYVNPDLCIKAVMEQIEFWVFQLPDKEILLDVQNYAIVAIDANDPEDE